MAGKRYQVFVSSTYEDLKIERWEAAKVLLSHDCFVSGMEFFPATGDDQFDYIKDVIDECDFYILILGGRYGSTDKDGISYTEKEYDYAIEKGLKPISFVFDDPAGLEKEKREEDPEKYKKFCDFREKALRKLGTLWHDINELKVKISESISYAIRHNNAVGWVRGNSVASEEILNDINKLRKENDELKSKSNNEYKEFVNIIDNPMTIDYSTDSNNDLCTKIKINDILEALYLPFLIGVEYNRVYDCIDNHVGEIIKNKERIKNITIKKISCRYIFMILSMLNIVYESSFHTKEDSLYSNKEGYILTDFGKKMCTRSLFGIS